MSKYTTEVRFICETSAGLVESAGYSSIDSVIASAIPKIFDFDFPIFDEKYRSVLETKILKHYYTREIGEETVGLWKLRLNTRLNEIMPYYNKLYESELLEFNPLYDVDLKREHNITANGTKSDTGETTGTSTDTRISTATGTASGTSSATSTGTATGTAEGTENTTSSNDKNTTNTQHNLHSDTPQGGINNIEDADYLTDIKKISDTGTETNTGTSNSTTSAEQNSTTSTEQSSETQNTTEYTDNATNTSSTSGTSKLNSVLNNTEDYLEQVSGKTGSNSYSKLLQEYRQTFLNIDMSVIHDLKDLFMNLW